MAGIPLQAEKMHSVVNTANTQLQVDLSCNPPESLTPLLDLLQALTELAFIGGVGIGTLGFMFAGIALAVPGQDWTQLGKQVIKQVFIGVVLLLSAQMIVDFLISQMGGVIC